MYLLCINSQMDAKTGPVFLRRVYLVTLLLILCLCVWFTQYNFENFVMLRRDVVPIRGSKYVSYKSHVQTSTKSDSLQGKKQVLTKKICTNIKSWKDPIDFRNCAVQSCEIIKDLKSTGKCDAVLFQVSRLPRKLPRRHRGQIWIFLTHEPPSSGISRRVYNNEKWKRAFNMTMSFRKDSEFQFPWGEIIERRDKSHVDFDAVYDKKSKEISWMASHCHTSSKREIYVDNLKKIIPVDVYGRCGKLKCKRSSSYKGPDKCRDEMSEMYKFYLSFENTICPGYSTEKIFLWYHMRRHIIPVYRGASNIKEILPPNTYIDAADFPNAEKLGHYLKKLGNDRERYIAMLKEKDKFESLMMNYTFEKAVCSVCAKLHGSGKIYSQVDLNDFKHGCKDPTDLIWLDFDSFVGLVCSSVTTSWTARQTHRRNLSLKSSVFLCWYTICMLFKVK